MTTLRAAPVTAALVTILLSGCHHEKVVKTAVVPPPPVLSGGPVMVSVPPPTHRAISLLEEQTAQATIPVMQPVHTPKKEERRPPVAVAVAPAASPQLPQAAPVPTPAPQSLGQLTAGTDNTAAARGQAEQAIRVQRDRVGSLSNSVQTAHPSETDQARRFVKSATESWNAGDYTAAVTLATKAKVLLDDLLK